MSRRAILLLPLLLGCAHGGESLVSSMATLGPRLLVIVAEEPIVASGGPDALCIACPEGWSVQPAASACAPPAGAAVELHAALSAAGATQQPGDGEAEAPASRLDLPLASERRVGEQRYLCLGPAAPLAKGACYGRATVHASAPLLAPAILWVAARPSGVR